MPVYCDQVITVDGEVLYTLSGAEVVLGDCVENLADIPSYEIRVYDHDGVLVNLISVYEYLEFSQRINDSWSHILRLNLASEDDRLDFFREDLVRDYIFEVYRVDPVVVPIESELVYEGLHRTIVDQIKQDGSVLLTLYGTGYTQFLKRRVIVPLVTEENSVKTGPAETAIKDFVDEQAINPTDTNRIIPGLSNEVDSGVGDTATYSARYTNLFTAVTRLAEQGGVDFGITKDTDVGTFELQVRELWGTDRRVGNADGNVPTIFDVTLNNMIIPILSHRGSDETNFVYIGGQGQGIDRVIRELEDTSASGVSPWNRHESFVDARNEADSNGLDTRGQAYLNEHRAAIELTFNVAQTLGTRWLQNWELGDIITARYAGITFTKKIVQVNVVVSAGDTGQSQIEVISAEMEDVS